MNVKKAIFQTQSPCLETDLHSMSDSIAENITALLSKRRRRKKLIIETKGVYIYVCMCVLHVKSH